jgi:cbb3-type cytochrome oxidase subunit 1
MNMLNTIIRNQGLKTDVTACLWGLLLAVGSLLAWAASLDREPLPLGAMLRLAAIGLVVVWSHYLLWLFGKMLNRRISNGYCAALFFSAWAVFFLIYNCLV